MQLTQINRKTQQTQTHAEKGGNVSKQVQLLKYFLETFPPFTFVLQRWTLSLGLKSPQ